MQEIVLLLSSLAGVATAAAVRNMPRNRGRLLSIGASSHIKSQASALRIERDILTKTISRLHQSDAGLGQAQKEALLSKYQRQLGVILARLDKLEEASRHPDLGPLGDGLITLMDQKLSSLDRRLDVISSRMTVAAPEEHPKTERPRPEPLRQEKRKPLAGAFAFRPKKPAERPAATPKPGQSVEITTLTNIPTQGPAHPPVMESPQTPGATAPLARPADVEPPARQKTEAELKHEIVRQTAKHQAQIGARPDIDKEVAKMTAQKALPGPVTPKQDPVEPDDDPAEDEATLDKIRADLMKTLSKLEQAEVE